MPPANLLNFKQLLQRPARQLVQTPSAKRLGARISVGVLWFIYWSVLCCCLASAVAQTGGAGGVEAIAAAHQRDAETLRIKFNMLEMQTAQEAQRKMRASIRFLWDQQPLRDGVASLGRANGIAIWLDRRLDPGQLVSYLPSDEGNSAGWPTGSLGARMQRVTEQLRVAQLGTGAPAETQADANCGLIENVWYLGPADALGRLQRAAIELQDDLHQRAPELARMQKPLEWPELATPQQILEEIAREWDIEIDGRLPHDLMHAGRLETPAHLATQLVLLCGGFELEPKLVSPTKFELVPLRPSATWTASYPKARVRSRDAASLRAAFPGSNVRGLGQAYELTGSTEFHLAMLQPSGQANDNRPGKGGVSVWSFTIDKAPAEAIIANLASGIGLQVVWNEACTREQKSQLLTLTVDKATLDQLLTQVCEAAGLRYTRDGTNVELFPK